jgi:predicted Zn-dependent protease
MKYWLLTASAVLLVSADKPKPLPASKPITASDRATGSKAHPQLVAEFGGEYAGPQADYVRKVGQKIAVQSGLSNTQSDFTITLLNSNVNNAFAVPGGYVYITRQLLALMNNEAELASVMGHEVGHVAARHSQKRNSRATMGGLGQVLATVLGGVVGGDAGARIGQQVGGAVAQNFVLSFSRSQEYQSDDLGITYLAKAGYDPMAASTMLASLASATQLELKMTNGKLPPVRESTHPDPASRVTRAAQKAGIANPVGKSLNRDVFLDAIDGMMYDDDPKQGVVDGQTFKHPDLKIAFTAPQGLGLVNTTEAVIVRGTNGQAKFMAGPYSGDLSGYIGAVFKSLSGENTLPTTAIERVEINGVKSAYSSANANSQSGPVTVTVFAYELSPTSAFHFVTVTPQGGATTFDPLHRSFRRLSASEAAAIKPRKVDVIKADSNDTVQSLSARMAYDTLKEERFRTLNALGPGGAVVKGQRYKLIVY